MTFAAKDTGAAPTYEFDYALNFLDTGETIIASTWTVEPDEGSPAGMIVDADAKTATTTTVRVSGGTQGKVYRVTNRIMTDLNNTDERTLVLIGGHL